MSINCPSCNKLIRKNSNAIECDICLHWIHRKCSGLSIADFKYFCDTSSFWLCEFCRNEIFPFNSLSRNELLEYCFNSNTACLCSSTISEALLSSLPCYDIISSIDSISYLSDFDIDTQLHTKVNFNYYNLHHFMLIQIL